MKPLIYKFPEYYLIMLVVLAGYSPPFNIHPICIGIMLLLILQIVLKNKTSGLILGALFFLINLFFLGALIAEINEFTKLTTSAIKLLIAGFIIWIANLTTALVMIYKYTIDAFKSKSNLKLEKEHA